MKAVFGKMQQEMEIILPDQEKVRIERKSGTAEDRITIRASYQGVYGLGEKFDSVNHKGQHAVSQVVEKFCNQGENAYCVTPFFMTDTGFGIYFRTDEKVEFDFGDSIVCRVPVDCEAMCFSGSIQEILRDYMQLFPGLQQLPDYAFGPWISANHWNCQNMVKEQLQNLRTYSFPATVLVLEAWSDEATFYTFHGAEHQNFGAEEEAEYEDFDFTHSTYWPQPRKMIEEMKTEGLHLVLWQIPVWKKMGADEEKSIQSEMDRSIAARNGLCILNTDGTPYEIPEGHWFAGSYIPDFTNEETRKFWFGRRKYLLEMGVDGFKTDGGEFIYSADVKGSDGSDGKKLKNRYCQDYLNAYSAFIGKGKVLFSRAGYAGAHRTPIHWAGDHQSTNEEFEAVLKAGLSAAMSGIGFWGFDIGGFAGELPDQDLYLRSTQMACFCPVMQWHSEPDGGQFAKLMPGMQGNNERSPWNIAARNQSEKYLKELRYWHWLRMNLLPYLYSTGMIYVQEYRPMMCPLIYEWEDKKQFIEIEDEYLFGKGLLIAPLMKKNQRIRELYLPEGNWYGFFSHQKYKGEAVVNSEKEKFPVFIREGRMIALSVQDMVPLGCQMDRNDQRLHLLLAGNSGMDTLYMPDCNINISWDDSGVISDAEMEITWEKIE